MVETAMVEGIAGTTDTDNELNREWRERAKEAPGAVSFARGYHGMPKVNGVAQRRAEGAQKNYLLTVGPDFLAEHLEARVSVRE
jgi:hypothetical protein